MNLFFNLPSDTLEIALYHFPILSSEIEKQSISNGNTSIQHCRVIILFPGVQTKDHFILTISQDDKMIFAGRVIQSKYLAIPVRTQPEVIYRNYRVKPDFPVTCFVAHFEGLVFINRF